MNPASALSAPSSSPEEGESVGALYDQYLDRVWRTLSRLGVETSSLEDAAHEVFLVLQRRLPEFEHRAAIGTYIYAITVRVAQAFRRLAPRHQGEPLSELLAADGTDPEQDLERKQSLALLKQLLEQLSPEQREIFVLSELEELPAPEIAAALGIPLNTVYSRLRLARRRFEQKLAPVCSTSSRRHP